MSADRRRLSRALLLSLLIHALLLNVVFDGEGTSLLGFRFPWQDRRITVPELHLVLVPAQDADAESAVAPVADPLLQASVGRRGSDGPALTPSAPATPTPRRTAAIAPEAQPRAASQRRTDAAPRVAAAESPLRADPPADTSPPPAPRSDVIALAPSDEANRVAPAAPTTPAPDVATAPGTTVPESAVPSVRDAGDAAPAPIDREARVESERQQSVRHAAAQQEAAQQEAARQEAARQEAARQESARHESARQETARQEAARQEAARQEAARQEAARQEAARQEAARQEAARQEAARQETARQEAARQEAARQEAARQETLRHEAARQEAARQEAVRQEAARQEAARREAAEKREAVLRAIGRQLDEEAARREAASVAARQLPLSSGARRGRLFGRTDPNAELVRYAEAWSRKIELNMTFDMVREAAKQPHRNPLVTVAIRSDGSIESVTFVLTSGVPAIDEAILRVIESQKPYQAFPPGLASEFDVIEIRRSWYFDVAIRLY